MATPDGKSRTKKSCVAVMAKMLTIFAGLYRPIH